LNNTDEARSTELRKITAQLCRWLLVVQRAKAVYHTMNLFNYDSQRRTLIAEAWCPSQSIGRISQALRTASDRSGTMFSAVLQQISTASSSAGASSHGHGSKQLVPPTHHRTNIITSGFQEIIDAYGIASYQEINPGLFAVVTFPFLFAVMFGDFGHGLMMTAVALALIYWEKPLSRWKDGGEVRNVCLTFRYRNPR